MKNHVKVERAKKGVTQEDVAKAIGVSRQTVISIESGKYIPSTVLALKMAAYFGCCVEDVFVLESTD